MKYKSLIATSLVAVSLVTGCGSAGHTPATLAPYDKLATASELVEQTPLRDSIISFSEYYEGRKKAKLDELKGISELLGEDVYKNMVAGIGSEYFKKYCNMEYKKVYNNISEQMVRIPYMEQVYNKYKGILGIKSSDTLTEPVLNSAYAKDYYDKYTHGPVHDMLVENYYKYETLVKAVADSDQYKNELSDDADLLIESEIYNNVNNIKDINIDWELCDNNGNTLYKATVVSLNKELLDAMQLYKSVDYYENDYVKDKLSYMHGVEAYDYDKSLNKSERHTVETKFSLCGGMDDTDIYVGKATIKSIHHADNLDIDDETSKKLTDLARYMSADRMLTEEINKVQEKELALGVEHETSLADSE